MSADASASFDLEDDSLSAGLDAISAKFAAIGAQITASFSAANAKLTGTATAAHAIGAAAPATAGITRAIQSAASAGSLAATAFGAIATTAARITPLVRYLPNSMGSWVPGLKQVSAGYVGIAARVGLVTKAASALTGRLTALQAGFAALEMREIGASRAAALFGAASGLALSKTIASARGATAAIGTLATAMSATASRAAVGMGSAFTGAFSNVSRGLSGAGMVLAPMAGLALSLGPIGAGALGVAAGFSAVKKSISSAAEIQTLQMSFVTLLGSADAARGRIAELSKFASTTPFEIPGVVRASKVLETLTKGALSTGPGLRMVGDAAAVSGQPVEDLAVHMGRLYDGLMNGRAVGESLMRLQELGLVSSSTRAKIEELQKAGEKGNAVWKVAAGDLGRFSGEMQRQSGTWSGMLSNISDAVGNIFRAFGAPLITSLTPFLGRLQAWLASLTTWAENAGTIFAGWSALVAQIFADGKMGDVLARVGKLAFMEATNLLLKGLVGVAFAFGAAFLGAIKGGLALLSHATTSDFWAGLRQFLLASVNLFSEKLQKGLLVAHVLLNPRDREGHDRRAEGIKQTQRDLLTLENTPVEAFADWYKRAADGISAASVDIGKAARDGVNATPDLLDTARAKRELFDMLRAINEVAQKEIKSAAKAAESTALPEPYGAASETVAGNGKGNNVASLQKIAGGGGFSITRADPLLSENRKQTSELHGMRRELKELRADIARRKPTSAEPVFG